MTTREKNKYVLLSNDLMFKYIFGTTENKKFTADLLETFFNLESGTLKDIEITNSVVLDRKMLDARKFELDILVRLPDGSNINIEMQNYNDINSEIKNTLYIMGKFKDDLKPKVKYSKISKATQIDFLKKDKLHKSNQVIKRYGIINKEDINDIILKDYFEIIIVDVDAKKNIQYNKVNKRFELWRMLIGANTDE